MSAVPDGAAPAIIADHSFVPRTEERGAVGGGMNPNTNEPNGWVYVPLPPNPHLCQECGLAEAAHMTTTVQRD
jgi:hypothetical protein